MFTEHRHCGQSGLLSPSHDSPPSNHRRESRGGRWVFLGFSHSFPEKQNEVSELDFLFLVSPHHLKRFIRQLVCYGSLCRYPPGLHLGMMT